MDFGIATIFTAGLMTFLTPCVFPLIPVYLAALVGGDITGLSGTRRGQLILRSVLFAVGFTAVFTLMGLGASAIGAFLSDHRLGLQIGGALIVFLFALKFLRVIKVPLLDRIVKADGHRFATRFSALNAVVMGIVFAAGWSPCVGPVLGSVLTYTAAQTSSAAIGAAYLAVYGAGFAVPLILTAVFAEKGLALIGKLSKYLPRFERGMGALLLVIAGYMAMGVIEDTKTSVPVNVTEISLSDSSEENLENDVAAFPQMLELFSEDCPSCKKMEPIMDKIKGRCTKEGVRVDAVDVSKPTSNHLVQELQIVGVPTFLFFDELGLESMRLVGEQTEVTLMRALSQVGGQACWTSDSLRNEVTSG
jgi:cytochrome c-type biogenesis protein